MTKMTEEEKANELIEKFNVGTAFSVQGKLMIELKKQHYALILVFERLKFWQSVKKIIQNK